MELIYLKFKGGNSDYYTLNFKERENKKSWKKVSDLWFKKVKGSFLTIFYLIPVFIYTTDTYVNKTKIAFKYNIIIKNLKEMYYPDTLI